MSSSDHTNGTIANLEREVEREEQEQRILELELELSKYKQLSQNSTATIEKLKKVKVALHSEVEKERREKEELAEQLAASNDRCSQLEELVKTLSLQRHNEDYPAATGTTDSDLVNKDDKEERGEGEERHSDEDLDESAAVNGTEAERPDKEDVGDDTAAGASTVVCDSSSKSKTETTSNNVAEDPTKLTIDTKEVGTQAIGDAIGLVGPSDDLLNVGGYRYNRPSFTTDNADTQTTDFSISQYNTACQTEEPWPGSSTSRGTSPVRGRSYSTHGPQKNVSPLSVLLSEAVRVGEAAQEQRRQAAGGSAPTGTPLTPHTTTGSLDNAASSEDRSSTTLRNTKEDSPQPVAASSRSPHQPSLQRSPTEVKTADSSSKRSSHSQQRQPTTRDETYDVAPSSQLSSSSPEAHPHHHDGDAGECDRNNKHNHQQAVIHRLEKELRACRQVLHEMAMDRAALKGQLSDAISLVRPWPLSVEERLEKGGANFHNTDDTSGGMAQPTAVSSAAPSPPRSNTSATAYPVRSSLRPQPRSSQPRGTTSSSLASSNTSAPASHSTSTKLHGACLSHRCMTTGTRTRSTHTPSDESTQQQQTAARPTPAPVLPFSLGNNTASNTTQQASSSKPGAKRGTTSAATKAEGGKAKTKPPTSRSSSARSTASSAAESEGNTYVYVRGRGVILNDGSVTCGNGSSRGRSAGSRASSTTSARSNGSAGGSIGKSKSPKKKAGNNHGSQGHTAVKKRTGSTGSRSDRTAAAVPLYRDPQLAFLQREMHRRGLTPSGDEQPQE